MPKSRLMSISSLISYIFETISDIALIAAMVLTGHDIIGRALGHLVPGTFEA